MKQPLITNLVKNAAWITMLSLSVATLASASKDVTQSEEILTEDTSPEALKAQLNDEKVEQIEVRGSVPLLYYKRQVELAELDFYETFNMLADEDKYKVKCRREARTGSRMKTTACYPQYVLNRMAQETQAALNSGAPYPKLDDIEFLVENERKESLEYAEEIIKKNPKLMEKLVKLNEKQAEFEAKKAQN